MGRFLIDASLPRSAKEIALALGHEAIDVRDSELGTAGDDQISIFARENRLCILTRDRGFGNLSATDRKTISESWSSIFPIGSSAMTS